MKKIVYLIPLLFFLTACSSTAKFAYPADMNNMLQFKSQSGYKKKVAVLPFKDFRNDTNKTETLAYAAIPLFPYGWISYNRPEAARMFVTIYEYDCNIRKDLSKALTTSIRRSNLFNEVFFTFGSLRENSDFYITGEVYTYHYIGRVFSYGLSICGPLFWFFGLPRGESINKIELKLQLHKTNTQEILWEYKIEKEASYIQGWYYNSEKDTDLFTNLIQNGYNKALLNLKKQIRENPKKFD